MTRGAELAARGLSVGYRRHDELKQVLADVSLTLRPGVIVGLAGESGCGKSTLGLALTGYRPPGVVVLDGDVGLAGESLLDMPERRLSRLWGRRIAFVPQNAATALDPALTVGRQLREPLRQHLGLKGRDAESRAKELLERVDLEQPAAALGRYPHQFSGGQQQRIALSMALACQPDVIVLDEPTTGLDVTTQARVNELVVRLVREDGMAVLYVSHDLALLATLCDRLVVMYAGEIVEEGPAIELFARPRHPYTAALLRALPSARHGRRPKGLAGIPPAHTVTERCAFVDRCEFSSDACLKPVPLRQLNGRDVRCVRAEELTLKRDAVGTVATESRGMGAAVLEIENLRCVYPRERVVAVSGLSLELARGQVIGIAGESGSGKSTLLRCLAGLVAPDAGSVRLAGEPLAPLVRRRTAEQRRLLQLVFQNPDASLNPRHTVHALLERPLRVFRHELDAAARRDEIASLLDDLRLSDRLLNRMPMELSGGQRQRVALARALASDPDVLLCDEITSALDVSVQAVIVELLEHLCASRATAMIFVTHDLGVLRSLADEVVVLRGGEVQECGPTDRVYGAPTSEYTRQLLAAVPEPRVPSVAA